MSSPSPPISSSVFTFGPAGQVVEVHGVGVSSLLSSLECWDIKHPLIFPESGRIVASEKTESFYRAGEGLWSVVVDAEMSNKETFFSVLACLSERGWQVAREALEEQTMQDESYITIVLRHDVLGESLETLIKLSYDEDLKNQGQQSSVMDEFERRHLELMHFYKVNSDFRSAASKILGDNFYQQHILPQALSYLDRRRVEWGDWTSLGVRLSLALLRGYGFCIPLGSPMNKEDPLKKLWNDCTKMSWATHPEGSESWKRVLDSGLEKGYQELLISLEGTGYATILNFMQETSANLRARNARESEECKETLRELRLNYLPSFCKAVTTGPELPSDVWKVEIKNAQSVGSVSACGGKKVYENMVGGLGVHWALWLSEPLYHEAIKHNSAKIQELFEGVQDWLSMVEVMGIKGKRPGEMSQETSNDASGHPDPYKLGHLALLASHVRERLGHVMGYVTGQHDLAHAWEGSSSPARTPPKNRF